jgi:glycosyltransferase involved in cell wall biosynthesis
MSEVTYATIYPTGPLSVGSTAAVARLVSQVTDWLAHSHPGQVAAVCLPDSRLDGLAKYDLSLPAGNRFLYRVTNKITSSVGLSGAFDNEVALRTRRGVTKMMETGMNPRIILTATALAAILTRRCFPKARIILWAHSAPSRKEEPLATRAFRAADALVLPSAALYDLLWDRYAFEEFTPPVWIINNYIDQQQFFPPTPEMRAEARRKLGLEPNDFAIVHLSRGPVKGLQILQSALPLIRATGRRIVLLSAGDKVKETKRINDSLEIRRLGRLPVEELRGLYHAGDLGVVPSVWFETFALAALEMMTCGLCVLASRSGGLPEVIQEGRNGCIVDRPNDVQLWASMVEDLIVNDAKRLRLASEGPNTIIGKFDGAAFYSRWNQLFDALLQSSGAR